MKPTKVAWPFQLIGPDQYKQLDEEFMRPIENDMAGEWMRVQVKNGTSNRVCRSDHTLSTGAIEASNVAFSIPILEPHYLQTVYLLWSISEPDVFKSEKKIAPD